MLGVPKSSAARSARLVYRPFVICGLEKDLSWLARGRSNRSASDTSYGTCRNYSLGVVMVVLALLHHRSVSQLVVDHTCQPPQQTAHSHNGTIQTPGAVKAQQIPW